jgi:tetratricopeptide (TPR) repeat protein
MFTDMAGYTALMQTDEAAALRSRQRHRSALEDSVAGRNGDVLQYFGDGSLSIFNSSVQAVEAAVDIQKSLGGDPALRIGLHVGDIAYDVQGAYGDAVNIAARLESICVPGGVTISSKVYDDIRRHPQLAVVPSGTVRLKNIQDAVPTYSLAVEGLATPADNEAASETPTSPNVPALPHALLERLTVLSQRPPYPARAVGTLSGRISLVGRHREVEQLRGVLDAAESGHGSTVFLRGARGVGKTRLSQEAAEYARSGGWTVLTGQAHPSERLVPYAPFSDALMPVLGGLDESTLALLTPGDAAALCSLFPALGPAPRMIEEGRGLPGEAQTRLYWQFANALARLASYRPLLLILEDLDFADRSSLELFRFVARQTRTEPIVILAEYTGAEAEREQTLREIEQSLVGSGGSVVLEVGPLAEAGSEAFIREALDLGDEDVADLTRTVHAWSQGNPFFMTGTLRGLIESGAVRREGAGWTWDALDAIQLPRSVRDTVLVWMGMFSDRAVSLARSLAVAGRPISYEVARHISEMDDAALAQTLDELVRNQILVESEDRWTLVYSFRHPLIRETLRTELALSARRDFHARLAESLEAYYGESAIEHADELAYHFGRARPGVGGTKSIHYLEIAGSAALARQANREARDYFREALDRIDASLPGEPLERILETVPLERVLSGLARSRRRLGETQASVALWRRLLALAHAIQDSGRIASIQRQLGLTYVAGGALEEAIEAFEAATESAGDVADLPLVIRSQIARGYCYQSIGAAEEAADVIKESLFLATELGQPALLGRVHNAALWLNIWPGHFEEVRSHAEKALSLARQSGDRGVEFWCQWAMGAMEGLMGNTSAMEHRIVEVRRLADEIGSPLLHLETNELAVELAYARGDWVEGIELGERSIELARATDQKMVLPRLLVWVSLMHLGRGELGVADKLTMEAWAVSGAERGQAGGSIIDLHTVVPAHIGRAAFHLASGEWVEAVRVAEAGLEIADRSGYVVWAIHHILPIIAEASIHARDLPKATAAGARMRREADRVGHPLGRACADACDAVLSWLQGDAKVGAKSLRRGAEALESIPLTHEAARLRRQLAGRLAEIGDREGSLAELQQAHVVFEKLGARPELEKTIGQFGELGMNVPSVERTNQA